MHSEAELYNVAVLRVLPLSDQEGHSSIWRNTFKALGLYGKDSKRTQCSLSLDHHSYSPTLLCYLPGSFTNVQRGISPQITLSTGHATTRMRLIFVIYTTAAIVFLTTTKTKTEDARMTAMSQSPEERASRTRIGVNRICTMLVAAAETVITTKARTQVCRTLYTSAMRTEIAITSLTMAKNTFHNRAILRLFYLPKTSSRGESL